MKMTLGEKIFQVFDVLLMILLTLVTLYPLWYILVASFSDNTAVLAAKGMMMLPKNFTTAAYKEVLKFSSVWKGYQNTLIIVIGGTALNMVLTILGGYVLSRKYLYWNKYVSYFVVFTMYFSGGMIPLYFVVKNLHIYNTLWALLLPHAISTYNMIIMRTAFASVPDALEESAKIDGARHLTILMKIMLPTVMPTLAVLLLYYAVAHWNSWFSAMIYLKDRNKFPLQLILREILLFNTQSDNMDSAMEREAIGETIQYSVIIIATVPVLCIYPFLQKYFEKGVMIGAVKG